MGVPTPRRMRTGVWTRENRERERKRREAGVLRGQESGEKFKALIFVIYKNPKWYVTCIQRILRLLGRQASKESPLG